MECDDEDEDQDQELGEPFGIMRLVVPDAGARVARGGGSGVELVLLPYNFNKLLELIDQLHQQHQHSINSVLSPKTHPNNAKISQVAAASRRADLPLSPLSMPSLLSSLAKQEAQQPHTSWHHTRYTQAAAAAAALGFRGDLMDYYRTVPFYYLKGLKAVLRKGNASNTVQIPLPEFREHYGEEPTKSSAAALPVAALTTALKARVDQLKFEKSKVPSFPPLSTCSRNASPVALAQGRWAILLTKAVRLCDWGCWALLWPSSLASTLHQANTLDLPLAAAASAAPAAAPQARA
jgi:hypothetical protein